MRFANQWHFQKPVFQSFWDIKQLKWKISAFARLCTKKPDFVKESIQAMRIASNVVILTVENSQDHLQISSCTHDASRNFGSPCDAEMLQNLWIVCEIYMLDVCVCLSVLMNVFEYGIDNILEIYINN